MGAAFIGIICAAMWEVYFFSCQVHQTYWWSRLYGGTILSPPWTQSKHFAQYHVFKRSIMLLDIPRQGPLQSSYLIYSLEWRTSGILKDLCVTAAYFLCWNANGEDSGRFGLDLRYNTPVLDMPHRFVPWDVSRAARSIDAENSLLLCHNKFQQSNNPHSYGLVSDHSALLDPKFVLSLISGASSRVLSLSCLSSETNPRRWKFFSMWVFQFFVRHFVYFRQGLVGFLVQRCVCLLTVN